MVAQGAEVLCVPKQEYHFILKKILDRVAKKTAADVDATAAARATASAALAAVPGPVLA